MPGLRVSQGIFTFEIRLCPDGNHSNRSIPMVSRYLHQVPRLLIGRMSHFFSYQGEEKRGESGLENIISSLRHQSRLEKKEIAESIFNAISISAEIST